MFMIFLGAFFAVAVGDPFPGRFRFPNKESNWPVFEEKVYDSNPLVNSASFYQPTTVLINYHHIYRVTIFKYDDEFSRVSTSVKNTGPRKK